MSETAVDERFQRADERRKRELARKRRTGKAYIWYAMHREGPTEATGSFLGAACTHLKEVTPYPPYTADFIIKMWLDNLDLPVYLDTNIFWDFKPCRHEFEALYTSPHIRCCIHCGMLPKLNERTDALAADGESEGRE